MTTGIMLTFGSLLLSLLLIIVFYSKPRIPSIENKIFGKIILVNLFGVVMHILCFITNKLFLSDSFYVLLTAKFYLVYLVLWATCFTWYVFAISDKDSKKMRKVFFGLVFVVVISVYFIFKFKINFYVSSSEIYSYGPSVQVVYVLISLYYILWLYLLLKNVKKILKRIYIPIFSFMILGGVATIIQKRFPGVQLMTFLETFIGYLMYFTIENPDMKLLKEMHKAKEISDNANEEKTMFLYNMTQEIRNTTDKINDEADIILDSDSLEQDKDSARNIKGETAKFRSTVNDIMDVSAIDTSSIKIYNSKYNIKNLLKEIVSMYNGVCMNKGLEFRTNIEHNIPKLLYGDSINLKKSIMNILTTSIKSTDKGYIEFTVNTIIKNDICRLIITIEDSSIGKSSSELESIKQNNKSINESYKLITLMNGTMIISSDYGIGTKYKLIIDERIVNTTNPETNKYLKDYENKKILVIDDNKQTGLIFTRYLKNNHIAIDTAYTGRETLNKIKAKNKYDLIILDEELSQITGYELLKELKRLRNFTTKVILLTKDNNYEYNKKYQKEGFTDVLIKPFKKDILLTKLDKYLETK
ncbi:MAG: response regulator [Mycoplasmatota bacterium]|nr:response regulator [Mycoplasmatota bacterium]